MLMEMDLAEIRALGTPKKEKKFSAILVTIKDIT